MQVNTRFPVVSEARQSRVKPSLPVVSDRESSAQFSLPSSPVSSFEHAQQAQGASFSKVEGLDKVIQEAIASYQATQSMATDNPQDYLIGVDTFA
ncbi:hypothetical protein A9Q77_06295, partial [Marinomonas sp. 42_23_T18]